MWSFAPQTWTLQDGKPAFLHFWTDCNLKYARLAALGFMVVGAVVAYKAAKKCLTTVFDFFKNGASKAGEASCAIRTSCTSWTSTSPIGAPRTP